MRAFGRGCRQIELEVGRLPRGDLPSIHTVHVQASSKSRPSRPLRASWTFVVLDQPFVVTVRCVVVVLVVAYTVSQKTRHPIVTVISSNINRLSKFFHC